MNYYVLSDEKKQIMKPYLSPEDFLYYQVNVNTKCIYGEEDGHMECFCMVHVDDVAEITDINVSDSEDKKQILMELLEFTSKLLFEAGCTVVVARTLLSEGLYEVEEALETLGYEISDTTSASTFTLGSMRKNKIFKKTTEKSDIRYLKNIGQAQRIAYDNFLRENNLFEYFEASEISEDLSTIYLSEDGRIAGCFLLSEDYNSLHIEYAQAEGVNNNRFALLRMVFKSLEALKDYPDQTIVTTVNRDVQIEDMIDELCMQEVQKDYSIEYYLRREMLK